MKNRMKLLLGIVVALSLFMVSSCDDKSTKPNKVASPVFSPLTGSYNTFLQVEIESSTDGAEIRYSTDGSEPTELSSIYYEPITIINNTNFKARAFKDKYQPSAIVIAEYELVLATVATPTLSLAPGTYNFSQKVAIKCETANAQIRFTLDGNEPTNLSQLYQDSISVYSTTFIKARAFKTNFHDSEIISAEYVIDSLKVARPILNPAPGTYIEDQAISITCSMPGAEIRYTINGSEPTQISPRYYNPINITSQRTLQARAFKNNYLPSDIVGGEYEITHLFVSIPMFTPAPGTYSQDQTVSLRSYTPEAEIYYTLDGSEPTQSSPIYNNPILLTSTTTIKARAFKANHLPSQIMSARYQIDYPPVATPLFSPEPGFYDEEKLISLSCETAGAAIYYTLDGSQPTESSILYHNPFEITTTTSLKARAFKHKFLPSNIAAGEYELRVSKPTFSPNPGHYTQARTITISSSTSNATIYYTLDNNDPTESSLLYNNPLNIASTTTIKARAYKNNFPPSEIAVGNYIIEAYPPLYFALVEGGSFNNGAANITIGNFYICDHEVTQAEYTAVVGTNPSDFLGMSKPVEWVSWFDAVKYCNLRSINEGLTPCYSYNEEGTNPNNWSAGWDSNENHENLSCDFMASGYRLPTEMEWTYAAKGGNQTPATGYNQWAGTDNVSLLPNYAWYLANNNNDGTKAVKTKLPNQLGIWDMSGNVHEWCWDILGNYSSEDQSNPHGALSGTKRVLRGGGWNAPAENCTVNNRGNSFPANYYDDVGFRVVRRAD